MARQSLWRNASYGLLTVGGLTSSYLLYRTFVLLESWDTSSFDLCSAVFGNGCDSALLSPASWILGIPLAGWGVVFYLSMASLQVLGRALGEGFRPDADAATFVGSLISLIASLFLATLMLLGLASHCPLCWLIHATNLALFGAVLARSHRGWSGAWANVSSGFRELILGNDPAANANWRVVALIGVFLLAATSYQWILIQTERRELAAGTIDPEAVLSQYRSGKSYDIPLRDTDPRVGPPDAPVRLVVFSNFQCPGCRAFARDLPPIAQSYPYSLAIVFKNFPLDTECNPAVQADRHSRSCEAAWAAEAARRQGKFWDYHDGVFSLDRSVSEEDLREIAVSVGLDLRRFEQERKDSETRDRVRSDGALGAELDIHATPAVFLNGKRVKSLSVPALRVLIENELARRSGPTTVENGDLQ